MYFEPANLGSLNECFFNIEIKTQWSFVILLNK